MTRIEAQPTALGGGASRASSIAGELGGLQSPLRGAAAGAGAPPGAQGAIEHCCGQWGAALTALHVRAEQMDRNLRAAATAYAHSDEASMPKD